MFSFETRLYRIPQRIMASLSLHDVSSAFSKCIWTLSSDAWHEQAHIFIFVQCKELLVQCMQLLDHPVAAHLASSRSFASAVPYCTDLHAGVIMCQEAQQLAHCSSLVITRIQLHHDLASDVAFRIKEPDFHLHMFIHQTDASDNQDLDAKHARQQWDACLECCLLIKLEVVAPLT